MNSWESSYQQTNILIRGSMGDKIFNIFEINELCVYAGMTCDEPCEVFLEVNKEEIEYPCIIDMGQIHKFVMGLKDEMVWSRVDKQKKILAYVDSDVADRRGKKYVMTREGTIFSQKGDQYRKEFFVAELNNEDKESFSNLIKYDEELEMLED